MSVVRAGRRVALAVAAAVTVGLVSGCTAVPEEERGWRALVETVATQVSAGDLAGAGATVDALAGEVEAAQADGTLSAERADEIAASIALVRADLAALAPAPESTPTPAPAVEEAPAEQTPAAPVDDEGDDDDSGAGDSDHPHGGPPGQNKGKKDD